jgi:RNA polymerase sigma-70 factor (ECF subfamily)
MARKNRKPSVSATTCDREHLLIQRIAHEDRVAFEELYYLYHRRLMSFLLRLTQRPALVEEAVNDTMLTVWQKASDYRHESRPSTWIFGIAYRKALKSLRQVRRKWEELPPEIPERIDAGPETLLRKKEMQISVQEALECLSPEHRAVVELTYFHGYSYMEIAEITASSVNTVKTRMFYARRRLKRLLPRINADFAVKSD